MTVSALGNLKGALELSVYLEKTRELLHKAAKDRDMTAYLRAVLKMNDPRFYELPTGTQMELDALYALAVSRTGVGQP